MCIRDRYNDNIICSYSISWSYNDEKKFIFMKFTYILNMPLLFLRSNNFVFALFPSSISPINSCFHRNILIFFGYLNTYLKRAIFYCKYSKSKNINIYLQQATTWKISVRRLTKGIFVSCLFIVQIFMVTR